ncbi:hypothetical protein ACFXA0_32560, partial [Streptomyces cyaneofuscatus]|uniref:hypothetical protein n=1 Tax=Streptomyces cyaneofuscatus TaxID=66883 RepID=UPI00369BE2A4
MPEGRGQEDGKGLIESDSPKGKRRESELPGSEEQQDRLTRFDRESDTKESDRVGNAGQQDKETRREAPGG